MSQTETPAVADEYPALQSEIENLRRTVADREADIAELEFTCPFVGGNPASARPATGSAGRDRAPDPHTGGIRGHSTGFGNPGSPASAKRKAGRRNHRVLQAANSPRLNTTATTLRHRRPGDRDQTPVWKQDLKNAGVPHAEREQAVGPSAARAGCTRNAVCRTRLETASQNSPPVRQQIPESQGRHANAKTVLLAHAPSGRGTTRRRSGLPWPNASGGQTSVIAANRRGAGGPQVWAFSLGGLVAGPSAMIRPLPCRLPPPRAATAGPLRRATRRGPNQPGP